MKIIMIGHKYVPSREGGIEVVVDNLATRMVKKGHEVTLFNRKRKEYEKIKEYKGCKIENIFTINKKSFITHYIPLFHILSYYTLDMF